MGEWLPVVTIALEDRRFRSHFGADPGRRPAPYGVTCAAAESSPAVPRLHSSWSRSPLIGRAGPGWPKFTRIWPRSAWNASGLRIRFWSNTLTGATTETGCSARWPRRALTSTRRREHLSLPEAIYLAGLPQAPSRFNPWTRPDGAAERYRRSVAQLAAAGFLSPDQAERMQQPPAILRRRSPPRLAPHFLDEIHKSYPRLRGGPVETTLDLDLQRFVETRLRTHLGTLAFPRGQAGRDCDCRC